MSTDAPTHIGKYRVLDLLGEGAMGVVYRAEDTVLARRVAVKVMTEAIAREDELRDRFLREARAAGSLQHPNVVTIYDFGEVEGHLFIAMEYVDGVDLAQLLAREEPLALDAKLAVVGDVLSGLAYAHKRGVVHRDIKPANVRVTDEGRGKIMDFGIAYVASSELTRTGLALGTPSYMAPEQVTGGQVTAATDIFAVGVMLYELLAGVKPFAGPTLHSILFKIVSEEPADLLAVNPNVPPAIVPVVRRALQKDPAERYATALEMASDVAAVRAALGGVPGQWTLSLRAAALHAPAAGISATAVAAAVPAGGSPVGHRTGGATGPSAVLAPAEPTVAERTRARYTGLWIGTGVAACAVAGLAAWAARARQPAAESTPVAIAAAPPTAAATPAAPDAPAVVPAASRAVAPGARQTTASQATASQAAARHAAAPQAAPPSVRQQARATPAPLPASSGAAPTAVVAASGTAGTPAGAAAPSSAPAPAPTADHAPAAPSPASDAGAASTAAASAEIADAARAYARAIESRDVAAVRRAYPGITDAQERGFRQFFDAARNLRVTFGVRGVEVAGNAADARLTGAYEYVTPDGQHQHDPVDFAATFRREGGAWRLTAVR